VILPRRTRCLRVKNSNAELLLGNFLERERERGEGGLKLFFCFSRKRSWIVLIRDDYYNNLFCSLMFFYYSIYSFNS